MKTLLVGAGEVGTHIARKLTDINHSVTVIERHPATFQAVDQALDARVLLGNGSSASVLKDADIASSDNFLALTSDDHVNLVACTVAKALNPTVFTVARVHDQSFLDSSLVRYEKIFGVDYLLNPEALCAVELAKLVRNPGRVAVESFARGQIEVQEIQIAPESKLTGQSLLEIGMGEHLRIGALSRKGTVEVPTAKSVLEAGDILTLFGKPEEVSRFRQLLDPKSRVPIVRVVLYGGSEIAIGLMRILTSHRFRIRVIEPDHDTCLRLAERFPHITVVHGDATSRRLLEDEQIGDCDYFIACTKRDEDNIVTSLQVAQLGVDHVQLVINKPDYQHLLSDIQSVLRVENIVSLRKASADELLRYLDRSPVVELCDLEAAEAIILDLLVGPKSRAVGTSIRDLDLPPDSVMVALVRDFQAKVPGAGDTIAAGDRVALIVKEEHRREVVRLFTR